MPFEHLKFTRHWQLSPETTYKLGQCDALTMNLMSLPLGPAIMGHLKQVSMIKGAQATTAIEGNTLTEEEIGKVLQGEHLAESKAYQEQEVNNILRAMNKIQADLLAQPKPALITPELLKQYHRFVGDGLSAPFNATPGVFAQSQRVVGHYRCPPPGRGDDQVEGLVKRLCEWLQTEFGFASGKQSFRDGIIQAIVTHMYIEWIHPFDDGNGRTGRLVEFYLLLRAGVPDICAHILSNHYNNTRPEYYAHIQKGQTQRELTDFIAYAITGFVDGLNEVWSTVTIELLKKSWQEYVRVKLNAMKWSRPVLLRRKKLLLGMNIFTLYDIDSLQLASTEIARAYAKLNLSTVKRDIRELIQAEMLLQHRASKEVSANINVLQNQYPKRLQS